MARPEFITFTGIDADTDLAAAFELAQQYPVEYGVLFSASAQGVRPRFPSLDFVNRLVDESASQGRVRLAAHLCGHYTRTLLAHGETAVDGLLRRAFLRAQINTTALAINTQEVASWAAWLDVEPILQCRVKFPNARDVAWLFDASGGKGLLPTSWPRATTAPTYMRGYAGGLSPETIEAQLAVIEHQALDSKYWIDMESGVRDANDRFDLAKCRAVCEAVYGQPA